MRRGLKTLAVASAIASALSGCSGREPKDRSGDDGLTPAFAPETTVAGEAGAASTAPPTTEVLVLGGTDAVSPGITASGTATPATIEATVTDPEGDATASPIDPPPPWADLVGARLIRSGAGFELRIALGGGDAPESTDEDHTMNVASFYDVDGDGHIDYEVWANVASGGWGATYFDNGPGQGGFGEGAGVTVTTEGGDVVLHFPAGHLGDVERFRWSVASEWGRYAALGTPAMVRDDAPDDDQAAAFPPA